MARFTLCILMFRRHKRRWWHGEHLKRRLPTHLPSWDSGYGDHAVRIGIASIVQFSRGTPRSSLGRGGRREDFGWTSLVLTRNHCLPRSAADPLASWSVPRPRAVLPPTPHSPHTDVLSARQLQLHDNRRAS